MTRRDSGHSVLIIVIIILAVAIVGLLGWLFWQNFVNKSSSSANITTFEECKAAPGSVIMETFPEQCRTADGRTFTGPSTTPGDDLVRYCTEAEKLCFDHPKAWTVTEQAAQGEPGSKADLIQIKAPNDELVLTFMSGIGGLGGVCPDENKVSVRVLEATPAASLNGYQDEYNIDTVQVARVVYPSEDTFVAALYLTTSADYSTPGTFQACGIGFSQFVAGKNSVLSPDFDGAGSFTFGYLGINAPGSYSSLDDAIAAFDTPVYQQAAALLAGVHYE